MAQRHASRCIPLAMPLPPLRAVEYSLALSSPVARWRPQRQPSRQIRCSPTIESSYNGGAQFVRDSALDQFLGRVGRRLQDANPDAGCVVLRIHALDVPLPYSFVLKNGALYVSTGGFARLKSEAELAAFVAFPLAALCRGDVQMLKASQHQHALNNFVPNLLLITLTAGFGTPAISRADAKRASEERDRARDASDAVALHWLESAGYDPAAAPRAVTQLQDALAAEQRTGTAEFSDPAQLASRRAALEQALVQMRAGIVVAPATPPLPPAEPFHGLARRYGLLLARVDVDGYPAGLLPWVDRIDATDGASGYTAYLRAEYARRNSGSDAGLPAAIAAFETCVSFADAPVAAYRELGFLYRRAGDSDRARGAFTKYLQRAPTAADVPIVRTYLEAP
jgi:hypothetical protein